MDVLVETVPQREMGDFRKLIEFYDSKKYKKGLRLCEKLIEKSPQTVEYRSMRALLLCNASDDAAAALALAKEALRGSLSNSFSWQVCGIIYKQMKNYKESGKCYERAFKANPKNVGVLRDTANLQLHTRDLLAHRDTRRRALSANSELYQNWLGYALALRLLRQNDEAVLVIDDLLRIAQSERRIRPTELSNLMIFKAATLAESGRAAELSVFLRDNHAILDDEKRLSLELFACERTGERARAAAALESLVSLNPHNAEIVAKYIENGGEERVAKLREKGSLCVSAVRLADARLSAEDWKGEFRGLCAQSARKFAPGFAQTAKRFGRDALRAELAEQVLEERLAAAKAPTDELFALYALGCFQYGRGEAAAARRTAERACAHTPSFEDAHLLHAKALLRLGETAAARSAAHFAVALNTADRALATTACEVLFAANACEEAETIFARFVKAEFERNVRDLQMARFQRARARALLSRLQWSAALSEFASLDESFEAFFEDAFDFYAYSLRRFGAQTLYETIRFADETRYENRFFAKCAFEHFRALIARKRSLQFESRLSESERADIESLRSKPHFSPFALAASDALSAEAIDRRLDKIALRLVRRKTRAPNARLHTSLLAHFTERGQFIVAGRSALHLLKCAFDPLALAALRAAVDAIAAAPRAHGDAQPIVDRLLERLRAGTDAFAAKRVANGNDLFEVGEALAERGVDAARECLRKVAAAPNARLSELSAFARDELGDAKLYFELAEPLLSV